MRRLHCRSRELGVAVALAVTLGAARAQAQACCAGAGVFAPARLELGQDFLVGVQLRARDAIASFDSQGSWVAAPSETSEQEFEQDLLATVRPFGDLQLGLVLPLVETHRAVPGLGETGFGLGDVALNARYEIVPPNTSAYLPGIAVLAGASLPTGRAPDDASSPLSTDATGLGAAQLSLGLDVERAFGSFIADASGLISQRLGRTVGGVSERLGLAGSVFAAAGYAFRHKRALALTFAMTLEGEAQLNGQSVPDSGRQLTTLGISGGTPLGETWRLQGRIYEDLPVLGKNQTAGPGISVVVLRAW